MSEIELYQTLFNKLSHLPAESLADVIAYIDKVSSEQKKKKDLKLFRKLAGSWNDMSDEDFEGYEQSIKDLRKTMFNRDVEL